MSDRNECRRSPGRSYPTRQAALDAILTKRIGRANTGQVAEQGTHQVRVCGCGGFHVFTAEQLAARARRSGTGRRR
jgi:hypothetical protein